MKMFVTSNIRKVRNWMLWCLQTETLFFFRIRMATIIKWQTQSLQYLEQVCLVCLLSILIRGHCWFLVIRMLANRVFWIKDVDECRISSQITRANIEVQPYGWTSMLEISFYWNKREMFFLVITWLCWLKIWEDFQQ